MRPGRRAHGRLTLGLRWTAAIVFLLFGGGKFINHHAELVSFRQYGLPAADAFVYAIGLLEFVGALLLALGLLSKKQRSCSPGI